MEGLLLLLTGESFIETPIRTLHTLHSERESVPSPAATGGHRRGDAPMVKGGETTLALDAEHDDRCPTCSARANSCDIRVWLSGRSCCPPCTGPRTHHRGDGAVPGDPGHLDLGHADHLDLGHADHLDLGHADHHALGHPALDHHQQPQPRP